MYVTELGIVTEVNLLSAKADCPIESTEFGIDTAVNRLY